MRQVAAVNLAVHLAVQVAALVDLLAAGKLTLSEGTMTLQEYRVFEDLETRAAQAVRDLRIMGHNKDAARVDALLDRLLAAAHELSGVMEPLGLSSDESTREVDGG
jgi:hypothetical protein